MKQDIYALACEVADERNLLPRLSITSDAKTMCVEYILKKGEKTFSSEIDFEVAGLRYFNDADVREALHQLADRVRQKAESPKYGLPTRLYLAVRELLGIRTKSPVYFYGGAT